MRVGLQSLGSIIDAVLLFLFNNQFNKIQQCMHCLLKCIVCNFNNILIKPTYLLPSFIQPATNRTYRTEQLRKMNQRTGCELIVRWRVQ